MSGLNYSLISEIIDAADGTIVGRIRLQKIVYLLEKLGMNGGFSFSYYHYGPYSEDLSNYVDVVRILDGSIVEETGRTSYGNPFSIYKSSGPAVVRERLGDLPIDQARSAIARMKCDQSVVIELAATIHWLREEEKVADWRSEIKRRKASKATDNLIDKAERLLRDVGL